MAKHLRTSPLLRLLVRLGWQRDPDWWTVPCRDGQGRRARLRIGLTESGIVLVPSSPGPWQLTPLQVGRLRGAMRDALLSFDRLAGTAYSGADRPAAVCAEPPPPERAIPRQRVLLDPLPRPSAADIASRIAQSSTTCPTEVHHDGHDESNQRADGAGVAA